MSGPALTPLRESYAWCRRLTRQTAHNFHFSFLTLPRDRYDAMCVLYSFMRLSDDLGDEPGRDVEQRRRELADWRRDLRAAHGGQPAAQPLWPAFADICRRFALPLEALEAVLDGVERDLEPRAVATFAELEEYCYCVAGAVGVCCIHLWGFRGDEAIARAIDCGTALQLTNILRDLSEDAGLGRIYLPQEDLDRFGYSEDDLRRCVCNDAFRELMQFQAERARSFYRRAEDLFPRIEPVGRPILRTMLKIYGGLLDEIERRRFDVFHSRVRLPRWKKLWFAASSACVSGRPQEDSR
jgi:15-cis-phytoene synthase